MSAVRPTGLPALNLSHPLAANLLFYAYDYRAGAAVVNLVSNTSVGVTAAALSTAYGTLNDYTTGPPHFTPTAAIRTATATGNYTWACQFYKTRTVAAYGQPFARQALNGSTNPYNAWDFEINPASAGQTTIRFTCNSGNNQSASANGTIADNTLQTAVGLMTGTGSTAVQSQYLNGSAFGGTTTNRNPQDISSGDDIIVGGGAVGGVMWGAFWSRALTLTEIGTLHTDPYVLFGSSGSAANFMFAA